MKCPKCARENPEGAVRCSQCNTALDTSLPPTSVATADWSAPTEGLGSASSFRSPAALEAGSLLGGRYEILQLLGEGGMGAVYKARDRELNRLVALKVIRPDLANQPEVIQRFKQELILARQVTHKNVIRIFDLGEADGIKFISMDFVEGQDLRSLLRQKGKLTPEEAITTMTQVCQALDAAHAEGVVHRDLKPQNIMVDNQGRAIVMDFGIARSIETTGGLTQTGALVGTPEYMSPEQAKGQPADARSDLFTLGIIFYELLVGKTPYHADTLLGMLMMRTRERAQPPMEIDPSLPRYVSDVVMKCLEIDPRLRYQNASQIVADLEAHQRPRGTSLLLRLPRFRTAERLPTKWIAPVLAMVLLVIAGIIFRGKLSRRAAAPKPSGPAITLAILRFRNATGDPNLNWLGAYLAEALCTNVGQSASLHCVSQDRIRQTLVQLRLTPDETLDAEASRRVSDGLQAQMLVLGRYDLISIEATLRDQKRGRSFSLKVEAPNDDALLGAIDQLARSIRENLGLSPSVIKELATQAFRPSSKSLAALRDYEEGLQLLRQGRDITARKQLQASIQADPEFALAYSRLAEADVNLGHQNEAEQLSRRAVGLSQDLAPGEKYLIATGHARIMKDYPKAIEAYEYLVKVSPDDTDVQLALASLYADTGDFQKAREYYAAVLKADPQSIEALWKMGGVEIMSGNPQGSLDYLNRGLTLSVELGNDEKKALILQAIGIAYRQLNKPQEALRYYQQSLDIQRRLGQKWGMAASFSEMAQIYSRLGKPDAALASINKTVQLELEIGAKKEASDSLIDLGNSYDELGQHDQAIKMYTESLKIQREMGDLTYMALCLNNIGSVLSATGDYQDALTYLQQALELREKLKVPGDIAQTTYNIADALAKLGQYDQALKQYLRALELYRSADDKRGAAIDLDSVGVLFQYQGRYGAGLSSEEEALKSFRDLGERSNLMAGILLDYGETLAQAGRVEEARKVLDEAMALAHELKSDELVAQTFGYQGDCAFYRGDGKSAGALYNQALQLASRSADRSTILMSKFGLARVAIMEGRPSDAIRALRKVASDADAMGLKYLSLECSISLAEVLVKRKDYSGARKEIEDALLKSQNLGLRTLVAKSRYFLATALRLTGNDASASGEYQKALSLLDEIRKEPGAEKVISRADLNPIYNESTRWFHSGT